MLESPLSAAVEILASKSSAGIHRINVVDEGTGRVRGVLSQTDLVRYIWTRVLRGESAYYISLACRLCRHS